MKENKKCTLKYYFTKIKSKQTSLLIILDRRHKYEKKKTDANRMKKTICGAGAAAVLCITMIAALNIGAFAEEAAKIPAIGKVSQVLTLNSYETEKDDINISAEIPEVELISENTK
ncbi:hypothetical protein IMSAG049_00150 [Clostridiales bacterium]|nr:hypothetical protein IMSAG049_00150 [Clostridiales bacterium]